MHACACVCIYSKSSQIESNLWYEQFPTVKSLTMSARATMLLVLTCSLCTLNVTLTRNTFNTSVRWRANKSTVIVGENSGMTIKVGRERNMYVCVWINHAVASGTNEHKMYGILQWIVLLNAFRSECILISQRIDAVKPFFHHHHHHRQQQQKQK